MLMRRCVRQWRFLLSQESEEILSCNEYQMNKCTEQRIIACIRLEVLCRSDQLPVALTEHLPWRYALGKMRRVIAVPLPDMFRNSRVSSQNSPMDYSLNTYSYVVC